MPTKIHFLNVGHGDCTIIEHPSGNRTMIDINNGGDYDDATAEELKAAYPRYSDFWFDDFIAMKQGRPELTLRQKLVKAGYEVELTDPVEYYLKNWGTDSLFRYVQSHPDMDHMRGLAALRKAGIGIVNFWDTANEKSITDFTNGDEEDWREYQRLRKCSSNPTVLRLSRGSKGKFYNQNGNDIDGGDGLHILAPTPVICQKANEIECFNTHSYVLWLHYASKRVIFGGDATEPVWDDLHTCGTLNLKCDILKASHHGRASGFHAKALKAMGPSHIIVSVGKKPDTDSTSDYKKVCSNVLSTREFGNIVLTIEDSGNISVKHQYETAKPISLPDLTNFLGYGLPSAPPYTPPPSGFDFGISGISTYGRWLKDTGSK